MAPSVLDLSLGAVEIGVLLASLLYGMSLVQTYIYATSCKGDKAWLKAIVAAVCVFETLHTVAIWMYLYFLTVSQFGHPLALFELPWYFCLSVTFQAAAGGLVQAFYVWRVYIVSRKWWLTGVPTIGAIVRMLAAILITAYTTKAGNLPVFREGHSYLVYIATISSAVADLWNTSALCWFLKSRSTKHSQNVINRIIIWAIETGLVTSAAAILLVICWTTMSGNGLWVAALIIYGKLYSNSLLVSLNVRKSTSASLASSQQQHFSGSQSGTGPILFARTHEYDVSGGQQSISGKAEYSSSFGMPMTDLNHKNQQDLPFQAC